MTNTIVSSLASSAATLQSAADDGLDFSDILGAVPTDPASIFTLLLLVASFGLVLWFGRPKRKKEDEPA